MAGDIAAVADAVEAAVGNVDRWAQVSAAAVRKARSWSEAANAEQLMRLVRGACCN